MKRSIKEEEKPAPTGLTASRQPSQPPALIDAAAQEASARAVAEAEAARRKAEDEIIAQAAKVRVNRQLLRGPPAGEGKRGKTHWDHLMEEMQWLAKEFQRERRWKLQAARKAANTVQKSNLDLESRVIVKEKEEQKAMRKRASWIAREVQAFWTKAQRVVQFKIRTQVEAKKKEVLDKQLNVLLGQTQRYSTLLAERLAADERVEAVAAASKAVPVVEDDKKEPKQHPRIQALQGAGRAMKPSSVPPSAQVSGNAHDGDDTKDYRSGEDDDADDEATLEEEERIARMEGRDIEKDQEEEAAGLADDADLPIEELLARYGYMVPSDGGAAGIASGAGPSSLAPEDKGSDAESDQRLDVLLQDPGIVTIHEQTAPSRLAVEMADLSDDEEDGAPGPSSRRTTRHSAPIAASDDDDGGSTGRGGSTLDEDEYRSDEDDDADDEATLDEEERIAAIEGRNIEKDHAEEAAGLAEDADLPLEQLLAKYGYVVPSNDGAAVDPSSAAQPQPATNIIATTVRTTRSQSQQLPVDGQDEGAEEPAADIADTVQAMAAAQPTGYTLDTTQVKTPVPFLLKGKLREYQHIGMDWLVTLYQRRLNGILADEMGLGKTIQTIALLSWLACERGDWGPHLVVVPTSVMLNWEMEFKRWCPAFKLLTYYGSPKERAAKRQGWSKPNAFHVCITSYTLVLQDSRMFKRKKWKYLILDEAHMIKNWRSQRWQTLLNFNSKRRLLITGTPLQNDLMELWSLMHFLMPQVFASHAQFKDWFSNPLTGMVEGSAEYNKAIVERLHAVLRPFLLRRLKRDVEKQLPGKHEHVIKCRLSKRQRQLYEEYMASGNTRATLQSGNFLGIMNCLMQLRKVCNHPDLFEGRPIVSAFDMPPLEMKMPSTVVKALGTPRSGVEVLEAGDKYGLMKQLGLVVVEQGQEAVGWEADEVAALKLKLEAFENPSTTPQEDVSLLLGAPGAAGSLLAALRRTPSQMAMAVAAAAVKALADRRRTWRQERSKYLGRISAQRTKTYTQLPLTIDILNAGHIEQPAADVHLLAADNTRILDYSDALLDMVKLPERRAREMETVLKGFACVIPKARASVPTLWCSHPDASAVASAADASRQLQTVYAERSELLHIPRIRTQLFFPDRRLIQYDCGKLQELAVLLMKLKAGGHRALIFTQMSRMLDILEAFLNIHAYTYVRLDGATKPEQRQILMQRFNTDPRIFCFILSTRSGGVGMNLTGADTVIFYDSDWNPAMDAQAQDRCHRIGQTREVHIYRLVSEHTIEENILKKSDQKRHLDFLAIQSGGFTTDFLNKFDPKALLDGGDTGGLADLMTGVGGGKGNGAGTSTNDGMSRAEIQAAMRAAEDEGDAAAAVAAEKEVAAEMDEFIKDPPPGTIIDGGVDEGNEAGPSNGSMERTKEEQEAEAAASLAAQKEEEEAAMAEMAKLAHADDGSDPLAHLESALSSIERYAVRYVESEIPPVDPDAVAAQLEGQYKVDEFDVDAIDAAEEEREAEIDDDEEANIVVDWDQEGAVNAYALQRERAEAEEKEREAAELAWYAQYGLLVPPVVNASEQPSGGARGRGRPRKASGGLSAPTAITDGGEADTALSPHDMAQISAPPAKRRRTDRSTPLPQPWEPQEDLVLTSVVAMLLESGELPGPGLWVAASDALAAGAAATSVTGVELASRLGRLRTAEVCAKRYKQLRAAFMASTGEKENLAEEINTVRVKTSKILKIMDREVIACMYACLHHAVGQGAPMAQALLETFHSLRGGTTDETGIGRIAEPVGAPVAGPLPQAQEMVAAVRQGCGSGAARVIAGRLPGIVQAAKAGGALMLGGEAENVNGGNDIQWALA